MKIRIATALLALTLPLAAQAPASAETEALFYKAFWLEKGERDLVGAMALYEQFLAKAPEHKLAKRAAEQQYGLLTSTGKVKERDAFKAKYESLLGNVASAGAAAESPARGDAEPGARGARGQGAGAGRGGRMDPAARMAELEKQLASAKEEGDDEAVKRIEQQIERTKQMAERGARGQGGPGQGGQGQRGAGLFGGKKLADMTADELKTFKDGLPNLETRLERMRQSASEEQVKKIDASLADLKKGLEANKLDDAQKALDEIRASLPQRRGRGGDAAGNAGGGRGGRGGNTGGGGGNNGGGGGGNNGGGGGGGNGGGGGGR